MAKSPVQPCLDSLKKNILIILSLALPLLEIIVKYGSPQRWCALSQGSSVSFSHESQLNVWYKHDTEQVEWEVLGTWHQLQVNGTGKTIILILY